MDSNDYGDVLVVFFGFRCKSNLNQNSIVSIHFRSKVLLLELLPGLINYLTFSLLGTEGRKTEKAEK